MSSGFCSQTDDILFWRSMLSYVRHAVWCAMGRLYAVDAVTKPKTKLYDWNDARLLIACAEHGGFAGAADALGIDQKTISRRIAQLEAAVGRPLFSRRKSGSTLTAVGRALLERASAMNAAADELEMAMRGLSVLSNAVVTLSAPEGVLNYLVIPLLLGADDIGLPLDRKLLKAPPPNLTFVTPPDTSDLAILTLSAGKVPGGRGAERVRKLGSLRMVPISALSFLQQRPQLVGFDQLSEQPLVDVSVYRPVSSLDDWNAVVVEKAGSGLIVAPTTSGMHRAVTAGAGITLAPDYAPRLDPRLVVLDMPSPPLLVDLWLTAHEDILRDPVVRQLYDDLAAVFLQSPWFRA